MKLLFLALLALANISYAVVNGTAVTVEGTTICNNGSIERTVAGTMTTTCGAGWSVGPLPSGPVTLFEENFDNTTDWYNATKNTVGTVPNNWDDAMANEAWHPDDGFPGTQPVMRISGSDASKVYGGTGKAFIYYNESYDENNFNSDGFLVKDFTPSSKVYFEYYVKFQPGFAADDDYGQLKQFRVMSWDGPPNGRTPFFSNGYSAPIYLFDWAQTSFGLRHFHAFRCDDQATNYYCGTPAILNPPKQIVNGDMDPNYTSHAVSTDPQIPDLVLGGFVSRNDSPVRFHNNILGDIWHKVGLYLELNSSPGVQDGKLKYWLDDELVVDMSQVPWIGTNGDINAKWNSFMIGGNNYFKFDLVSDPVDRERWYAIDNIRVLSDIPAELQP